MSKLSFRGRKRPDAPIEPERPQWRAKADGPINLSARPTVDSATGQKAFVLAFAAVAVAGAAYFATMMLAPEGDSSVVTQANARALETQTVEAPPIKAAPAQTETKVAAASAAAPSAPAAPKVLDPVRVKTVSIPKAAPAPAAAPKPEVKVAAIETPPAPLANAYASDALVSEGITAVMGVVAKEAPAVEKKAAKKKATEQVAEAQPEMAGGAARKIRTAVTMRARPAQGGAPIGTIPTNASVTVAPGCKSWCQVSYEGKRGYIYKGFLR